MKTWLERRVPLGLDAGRELRWILGGIAAALLCNLRFVAAYGSSRAALYHWDGKQNVLMEGAKIAPFGELLGWSLAGCFVAAAFMAVLAAWHWGYHHRGAKSIYLMRRLPDRWELWRRCLTLPVLGAATYGMEALLLLAVDAAVYRLCTPAVCLAAGFGL